MKENNKISFFDAIKLIQKHIRSKIFNLNEDETKHLNSIFPPRYLLEIYTVSNPLLGKLVNEYINYDYNMHYKLTVVDAIQIIREFKSQYGLSDPMFPKKGPKDTFNDDFKKLKDKFKHGIGKPELNIFMLAAKRKDKYGYEEVFKISQRELNKLFKMDKDTIEEKTNNIKGYDSYKDYIIKVLLDKEKYGDKCGSCEFKNNYSLYLESNIPYDINDNHVDILIISDKPNDKLIMKQSSNEVLQQYIKHYELDKLHYVITNIVLCEPNDDKLTKCQIENCRSQVIKLVKQCQPTVIIGFGAKVLEWMGFNSTGIVNSNATKGEFIGYDVIKSIHPSYLVRNKTNEAYSLLGNTFQEAIDIIMPKDESEYINNGRKRPGDIISDGKIYAAKPLPKKFYKNDWVLINTTREGFKSVEHIFRNVNTGEKIVRKIPCSQYEYYYILKDVHQRSKPYVNVKDVFCKKGPWKFSSDKQIIERFNKTILYEGDVQLETKATVDYYYHSKPEVDYLPKVFRYDIEHDMSNFKGTDISAPYKITYISAQYENDYYIWILDSDNIVYNEKSIYKDHNGKDRPLIINEFAGNESLMLQHFWYTIFVTCNPDIFTAWNGDNFDFPYIMNRSKRLPFYKDDSYSHSNQQECFKVIDMFTAFNKTYNILKEGDWGNHHISGIIISDLMRLHADQHQGNLESNALDFVANLELGLNKKPFPKRDATREEWIEYNLWDTELMELIDNKVQATNYKFSLTKITKNVWHAVDYAMGIVDGLLLNEAKNKNICLRTSKDPNVFTNKYITRIIGGFTEVNDGGIYRLLADYDAKAMYPSIMRTFNIGPNTLRLTISSEDAVSIMQRKFDETKIVTVYFNEMECTNGIQDKPKDMTLKEVVDIIKKKNYIITPSGAIYCSIEEEKSLFYDVLTTLGTQRDIAKSSMYDDNGELIIFKYNRQLALKISANSFYGVYLFKKFMFFNTTIGASITMTGRFFVKTLMCMTDVYYGHSDKTLEEAIQSIDIYKQKDLNLKSCIYADTDGYVITYQDIVPIGMDLKEQLDIVESKLKEYNTYVAKIVNDIYDFFNKNGDIKYMKFKEDWLGSKGLFYYRKHKRYALHIVRENGKDKDELLYRGIQIRRSDSPKLIKERLSDLLALVLRKHDIEMDEIFERIEDIENELYDECAARKLTLAKPVKYSKLLSSYKKVPFQVLAMQVWNKLHNRDDFKVGDKGYFYPIQNINYDKIQDLYNISNEIISEIKAMKPNGICIPQDLEHVPEYIDINVKETIEKVFIIPYTNVLEPIIEQSSVSDIPIIDFL